MGKLEGVYFYTRVVYFYAERERWILESVSKKTTQGSGGIYHYILWFLVRPTTIYSVFIRVKQPKKIDIFYGCFS